MNYELLVTLNGLKNSFESLLCAYSLVVEGFLAVNQGELKHFEEVDQIIYGRLDAFYRELIENIKLYS